MALTGSSRSGWTRTNSCFCGLRTCSEIGTLTAASTLAGSSRSELRSSSSGSAAISLRSVVMFGFLELVKLGGCRAEEPGVQRAKLTAGDHLLHDGESQILPPVSNTGPRAV